MKNIQLLDCTLRDGGRIINCAFPDYEIRSIVMGLTKARINIVEVGFLRDWRDVNFKGNSTFFTDVDQIAPFLDKSIEDTMYVAFIDFGMFDFDTLKPCDGASIDGIRFGFTKKDYDEQKDSIIRCAKVIKDKGYKLFIQGVNTLSYSDHELLELIDMINELHPYSFGIVDTYGAMYVDDIDRLYGLIDHNMLPDICINLHSHNNFQLSFAFAQEIIKLSSTGMRQIIIDSTLGGMGKVSGNLCTELIMDYLIRMKNYSYDLDEIFDVFDDYIYQYSLKYKWGYSPAALMAGIYKSHPNNVIYFTEKFRLESKDIGKLLSMVDPDKRQRYDYDHLKKIYIKYISEKVDDSKSLDQLREVIENREVLILVPGNTLNIYKAEIDRYIADRDPVVISVNFIADYTPALAFFGNQKRYNRSKGKRADRDIIVSSNIRTEGNNIVVNYHSLINRGYKYFENSTIMLLNLLKRVGRCTCISIAGLDGFDASQPDNYLDVSFQNDRHEAEFENINKELGEMLEKIVQTFDNRCTVKLITPSRFQKIIDANI